MYIFLFRSSGYWVSTCDNLTPRRLSMESLSGGTISLSNIGTIGGTYVSPIINPPESAILAIGNVRMLPRYQDNNFEKVGNGTKSPPPFLCHPGCVHCDEDE